MFSGKRIQCRAASPIVAFLGTRRNPSQVTSFWHCDRPCRVLSDRRLPCDVFEHVVRLWDKLYLCLSLKALRMPSIDHWATDHRTEWAGGAVLRLVEAC